MEIFSRCRIVADRHIARPGVSLYCRDEALSNRTDSRRARPRGGKRVHERVHQPAGAGASARGRDPLGTESLLTWRV